MTAYPPPETSLPSAHALSLPAALELEQGGLTALLLGLMDEIDALLAIKDIGSGRYMHASPGMAALWSRRPEQMVGATDNELMDPAQATLLRAAEKGALADPRARVAEHRIEQAAQRRTFKVIRLVLAHPPGTPPRFMASVWVDVSAQRQRDVQLQQALAQLEQQQVAAELLRRDAQDQALRDGVTGLYKRLQFDDQLRREIDLSSREHREFALVAMTLDAPSEAARALGGEARTAVLEALGRLVTGNTRAMDSSCRLAEDRFAILLSGVGLATAHARMEGLRRQCATQIVMYRGQPLGFTLSMGVASFPHTAQTQQELSGAADAAMREALRRGGNQVTLAGIRFEPV